jgi:hypothetical protein
VIYRWGKTLKRNKLQVTEDITALESIAVAGELSVGQNIFFLNHLQVTEDITALLGTFNI